MSLKAKESTLSPENVVAGFLGILTSFYKSDCRWKRIVRGTLQVPFGLAAGVGLAAVLTLIFSVEVFMNEVYSGPFKQFLVYL